MPKYINHKTDNRIIQRYQNNNTPCVLKSHGSAVETMSVIVKESIIVEASCSVDCSAIHIVITELWNKFSVSSRRFQRFLKCRGNWKWKAEQRTDKHVSFYINMISVLQNLQRSLIHEPLCQRYLQVPASKICQGSSTGRGAHYPIVADRRDDSVKYRKNMNQIKRMIIIET